MLFITNREPVGSIKSTVNNPYAFDLEKNSPANSVFYCQRNGMDDYTEIGSQALMTALKQSKAQQLLLFIHGSANLPESDIFPRAALLQRLFDQDEPGMIEVVPLIWPCDNDLGVVKDYWDDQKSADLSGFSFARVLQKFISWRELTPDETPCLKRINVLAHSMGSRVLRETLANWSKYDLANGVPLLFRNTFLIAADIVNESLEEGETGHLISEASRNVSVYYAADDLALRASKIANLKNKITSRRLGHTGPQDINKVANNVYAIDCDNFNNQYDWPIGHAYYFSDRHGKSGKVFTHLCNSLKTGRVKVENKVEHHHEL